MTGSRGRPKIVQVTIVPGQGCRIGRTDAGEERTGDSDGGTEARKRDGERTGSPGYGGGLGGFDGEAVHIHGSGAWLSSVSGRAFWVFEESRLRGAECRWRCGRGDTEGIALLHQTKDRSGLQKAHRVAESATMHDSPTD